MEQPTMEQGLSDPDLTTYLTTDCLEGYPSRDSFIDYSQPLIEKVARFCAGSINGNCIDNVNKLSEADIKKYENEITHWKEMDPDNLEKTVRTQQMKGLLQISAMQAGATRKLTDGFDNIVLKVSMIDHLNKLNKFYDFKNNQENFEAVLISSHELKKGACVALDSFYGCYGHPMLVSKSQDGDDDVVYDTKDLVKKATSGDEEAFLMLTSEPMFRLYMKLVHQSFEEKKQIFKTTPQEYKEFKIRGLQSRIETVRQYVSCDEKDNEKLKSQFSENRAQFLKDTLSQAFDSATVDLKKRREKRNGTILL